MKIVEEINIPGHHVRGITLSGSYKEARRIVDGDIVTSTDREKPLVRLWSKYTLKRESGMYHIAVKEDGKWIILPAIIANLKEARDCLPGLHLIYEELCIIRVFDKDVPLDDGISEIV